VLSCVPNQTTVVAFLDCHPRYSSRNPSEVRIRPLHNHQTFAVLLLAVLLLTTACRSDGKLPAKLSKEYNEVVRAFYIGLAALQVGDDVRADNKLAQLTQLVPAEPAGWANWGLLALRQRNFDPASDRLERARALASENDQIYYLIGLLEKGRGRSPEAITATLDGRDGSPVATRRALPPIRSINQSELAGSRSVTYIPF